MSPAVPPIAARAVAPPWAVLPAPPHWRHVDVISDLHLQAGEPATFRAWQDFMQTTRADAVFILGDLFEVWVGDDVIDAAPTPGFEARCVQVLQHAAQRLDIFLMHGNRDFLLGAAFAKACNLTLLDDPAVLDFAGQRWLLSHGDALCLADTDYLQFRAKVRNPPWQQDFLGKPLSERQDIARALRAQSEARKRSGETSADVDADLKATCDWLRTAHATTLIHGHTHKPADHDLGNGWKRIVLSDWDAAATPPRAEVLRLSAPSSPNQAQGGTVQRLAVALAA